MGDWQVPEGFYHISRFNPQSRYHLALQVSYPNQSDAILGKKGNLGGDIMIHGACITIGCLPMTNEGIEEIYIYSVMAKSAGQNQIPVYIFPAKPNSEKFQSLLNQYKSDKSLIQFWKNLEEGYSKFLKTNKLLKYTVGAKGAYIFEE
jgi:murein L,D-transpeptidase YafK